jgi:hypothetical protein
MQCDYEGLDVIDLNFLATSTTGGTCVPSSS